MIENIKVIKRDGRVKTFDKNRIITAIDKAYNEVYGENSIIRCSKLIADTIHNNLIQLNKESIHIEEIQNIVITELSKLDSKVAESYSDFRENRSKQRERKKYDLFMEVVNAVSNDVTKENANMNAETPSGMMMKFASETSKQFTDDCLISKKARDYIKKNYVHIHDKDYYPTKSLTCVQHPLDKVLQEGFRAGHGSSRPAKRIETASIIGCISMETAQNEEHGGQAIPAFDYYLAPYVRESYKEEIDKISEFLDENLDHLKNIEIEDYITKKLDGLQGEKRIVQQAVNKTVKRVHQAMEAFIHNMNTIHSRGGNQVVFSSINYGTDTSAEGRCIIREILLSTYDGVGNNETAIFPIQIFKKKKGINFDSEDKNYDLFKLACKVTAKRFFPNFINLDATFNQNELWKEDDPKRYLYECATIN